MRLRSVALLSLLSTLGLVACSSGEADSASSIEGLASDAGCALELDETSELFVAKQGACDDLTLYWFSNKNARDSWLGVAVDFGLGPHLIGSRWVIVGQGVEQLDLDGELVN